MKRWVALLFFLLASTAYVNAQLVRDLHKVYTPGYFEQNSNRDTSEFKPWKRYTPGKTNYSIEVGTSYSSFGSGMGMSSSYISPSVVFSPTQNLMIEAGGRFSYNNFSGAPMLMQSSNGQIEPANTGNPTEAYVRGHYIVNNRLSVYGSGAFGQNQVYYSPYSRTFGSSNYQHISFGMDYKISEKVSIGASFGITNGPAWGTPYGRYGWSPFMP